MLFEFMLRKKTRCMLNFLEQLEFYRHGRGISVVAERLLRAKRGKARRPTALDGCIPFSRMHPYPCSAHPKWRDLGIEKPGIKELPAIEEIEGIILFY